MNARRLFHGLVRAVLVVVATAAGAAAGGLLGGAYVAGFMPNAGLDALGPMILGTLTGSVLGSFVELAVLFKLPRIDPARRSFLTAIAGALLALGLVGYVGVRGDPADPAWAEAAGAGVPLGVLTVVVVASSHVYARKVPGDDA